MATWVSKLIGSGLNNVFKDLVSFQKFFAFHVSSTAVPWDCETAAVKSSHIFLFHIQAGELAFKS